MVSAARFLAPAAGIIVDRFLGERPLDPHPVALFGSAMNRIEHRWWADDRRRGVAHAAVGILLGAGAGRLVGSAVLATYVAVGGTSLDEAAAEVEDALRTSDLALARDRLRSLAGRDPSELDADDLARAVVESLAENSVDAVIAPAFWAVVAGAPGALGYRAVNTLDAMVGHRSARHRRYGWASARLDDVANHVPARLAALLVAAIRPARAGEILRIVSRDAPAHPSPSGGVIESAFAAALDRRLGGPVRYGDREEVRPVLGNGPPVGPGDIAAARRLARDLHLAFAGVLTAIGAGATVRDLTASRGRRRT